MKNDYIHTKNLETFINSRFDIALEKRQVWFRLFQVRVFMVNSSQYKFFLSREIWLKLVQGFNFRYLFQI